MKTHYVVKMRFGNGTFAYVGEGDTFSHDRKRFAKTFSTKAEAYTFRKTLCTAFPAANRDCTAYRNLFFPVIRVTCGRRKTSKPTRKYILRWLPDGREFCAEPCSTRDMSGAKRFDTLAASRARADQYGCGHQWESVPVPA